MARRIKFRRKFRGRGRRFKKKSLMSKNNMLNFMGIRPVLKKIIYDEPIYVQQPQVAVGPPANDGYDGIYTFASGRLNLNVFANFAADPVYKSWARNFGMFQLKAVSLTYYCAAQGNLQRLGVGASNGLQYSPEIGFVVTQGMNNINPEFVYEMNRSMKVKPIDTTKGGTTRTYAFPPIASNYGQYSNTENLTYNQTTVWGSKVWFNCDDFSKFVNNNEYKQPVVYIGQNEVARLTTVNNGQVPLYFRLGHLQVTLWAVYAIDGRNTFAE